MKTLILVALSLLAACNYNHVQGDAKDSTSLSSLPLDALGFREIQTSVLGPKCLGCHAPETGSKGGSNMVTYADVRAQLTRISYRALEAKDMPPGHPLSTEEQAALTAWLDQGAPELPPPGSEKLGKKIEGPANFTTLKDGLFANKCLVCHAGAKAEAGLDLSDYAVVKAKATKIFESTILKQEMPMEPYPALIPAERKLLLKWFELGMPQ